MNALVVEVATFIVVFGAVLIAFGWGRSSTVSRDDRESAGPAKARDRHPGYRLVRQYSPPVDMRIEYRRPGGFSMLRDMRILRALHRRGHLYLFGLCDRDAKPRMFRADRITCFATLDGEVIDTGSFLIGALSIPPEFVGR